MKIDERTVIPIGWVMGLFSTGMAFAIATTFWVATVNNRLYRIEQKLGIAQEASVSFSFIPDALAHEMRKK